MEENKNRVQNSEEIETLDLGLPKEKLFDKEVNENLEGINSEEIKETILNDDLNKSIENEDFEEKIMNEYPVNGVSGGEGVIISNVDSTKSKKNLSLVIVIVVLLVLLVGALWFYKVRSDSNTNLKNIMKESALDYYDKYVSANTGASAYEVSLADLKAANEIGEDYKLDELMGCNGEKTKAIIKIDYSNGKVKDTEIKLDCKKI